MNQLLPPDAPMVSTFSQDASQFKKGLHYSANVPAETVIQDMNFLREFDRQQEKMEFWGMMLAGTGVVAAIGALILFAGEFTFLGGALGLLGVCGLVAGFIMKIRFGKLNLDNRRYELVAGLLNLLSKDMSADALTDIELDFTPHNHRKKFQREGKVGYWNAKFYEDRWLSIRGCLLDGTKFTVTVLEKQQDRSRTKISASGKRKHKTKVKNASEVIVSVKVKEKRYPNTKSLERKVKNGVQLPAWAGLKAVAVVGNVLTLRTVTKNRWGAGFLKRKPTDCDGVNWVAMSLLSLYKPLNDLKAE
jgi:hypothetical protein